MLPAPVAFDPSVPARVHVVAAGGSAMSGLARILHAMGHAVTGSDAVDSAVLEDLRADGIDVLAGHHPGRVAAADAVVASTAVPEADPELAAARALGVPVLRRGDLMEALCRLRRTVAVAGAHGKTTTTALLATVLDAAGFRPSYLVGAKVAGLGGSAAWRDGEWLVVEGDESDGTFLRLGAELAVVTNVEPDHLDHWGGFPSLVAGYRSFLGEASVRVVCADDPEAAALAEVVGGCVTYGTDPSADARLLDVRTERLRTRFVLSWRGEGLKVDVAAPGLHNARNAAAAAVAALELGAEPAAVAGGLAAFRGVSRRFELRGEAAGVTFVDSYDHLPTEVSSVLRTAREGRWGRVVCVFQPHRATRIRDLWRDFADSFVDADVLAVTDIYLPEGQRPIPGVDGRLVADAVRAAHPEAAVTFVAGRAELTEWLVSELRPGDLCLTLNAGDLTSLPDELLARLRA